MRRILFIPRSHDATAHYRVTVPAKYLARIGYESKINYYQDRNGECGIRRNDIAWADIIMFQRPVTKKEFDIVVGIKNDFPDKLVIGDYDDDYENVPAWNPGYTYLTSHKDEWTLPVTMYDGVIVSTDPLKRLIEKYATGPVHVVMNGMDVEEIDSCESLMQHYLETPDIDAEEKVVPVHKIELLDFNELVKDKIVIGWFGSRSHYCDIDWLPEQLSEVMYEDKDVYCVFVGYCNWRFVVALPHTRFWIAPGISPVSNYYRLLKGLKIDISLAPVDPVLFNESKSGIKVWEGMLASKLPVASEFTTYEDFIHEGLLAGYKWGDWKTALKQAVAIAKDKQEFHRRIEANQRYVRENHDAKFRSEQYHQAFNHIIESVNHG